MKESAASPDHFTIADPAVQECPYDYYRAMHESEPVHYDPNTDLWMIASYELAVEALTNWKIFSSAIDMRRDVGGPDTSESDALFEKEGYVVHDVLSQVDPPRHTIFRKLVDRTFTGPVVRRMAAHGGIPRTPHGTAHRRLHRPGPLRLLQRIRRAPAAGRNRRPTRRPATGYAAVQDLERRHHRDARHHAEPGTQARMRLESSVQGLFRVTTEDTTLGGYDIPKGAKIYLAYGAANRDDEKFPQADRLDVRRKNALRHLAFSHGIHRCIGQMLARKELEIAIRAILTRMTDIALDEAYPHPAHAPSFILRGLTSLRITFTKAA